MSNRIYKNPNWPEVWAGLECTVNRVGDDYLDQMESNGHANRCEDIARFAALGIRKMRYPVLWERIAPDGPEKADWSWSDERMACLRQYGIQPIAGFVHHGSGPRHTSLVQPCFVEGLTAYARAFAQRYPWVEYYTPVNEPLTTARFSGLYGHWYPHGTSGAVFAKALLNQCRATIEAMRVIRQVNPAAKLVQTEDLGKTYSTPLLAYQAAKDNERRWLSLDLLTGQLTPERPMWNYLRKFGVSETELRWFMDNPCPPDVIGINHYPTSERYLDERMEGFPAWSHGGNGIHQYADVEAIRVRSTGEAGHYAGHYTLLKETWERYRLPLAVTEVHIFGAREDQMQWLKHVWDQAVQLRSEGIPVQAITAWALLGTFDWVNLVTRRDGYYEPGVFDIRGPQPRPTGLARMLNHLAHGRTYKHPLLEVPGWWQRPDRFFFPLPTGAQQTTSIEKLRFGKGTTAVWPTERRDYYQGDAYPDSIEVAGSRFVPPATVRPVLIAGGSTNLGKAFARLCELRCIPYQLLETSPLHTDALGAILDELRPWALINADGYERMEQAGREPEACIEANTYTSVLLAEYCAARKIAFLSFSSDQVFDGLKRTPYVERDQPVPLSVYGRSKAQGEVHILRTYPEALVVRCSLTFDHWDEQHSLTRALVKLAEGTPIAAPDNRTFSPTYLPDLVHACLDLLVDGEKGIWHLANAGAVSWMNLLRKVAGKLGLDTTLIRAEVPTGSGLLKRSTVMESERGTLLPSLEDALARYCEEIEQRVLKGVRQENRARSY